MIELKNVSVMRGEKVVLHEVSLTIGDNEHVAILGPNGCGKSTLIKTITRECYPLYREGSRVSFFGKEQWIVFDLRFLLGIVTNDLMTQCTRDITGLDVVLSGFFSSIGIWPNHEVTPEMRDAAAEALHRMEATHLAERLVESMSSGEARRVLVARALVHRPRALVFDEPSNSLDVFAQHELRNMMRKLAQTGTGIILVTHHLADIIPEIDRVILMRDGRIVADGPKDQVLTADRLGDLFGVRVDVTQRDGYYHLW
jgi:iron complex transport system ATP-binding protein